MKTDKLKKKLDEIGMTQYELAKRLNIAPTTVNQWFARNSMKDGHIVNVCRVTGFDIKEFLPDFENNEKKDTISNKQIQQKQDSDGDIVSIPRFKNITASAGQGNYVDNIDEFEEDEPIPFLRTDLPSNRDITKFEAIKVKGTSMLPTFMPSDWVLFDRGVNFYDGDGLYVLNYAGNLLIKRLQYNMAKNTMDIISDNPQYENHSLILSENQENLNIVGAVLFKVQKEL